MSGSPAARHVNDTLGTDFARALQDVEQAHAVDRCVEGRILDRDAHVDLCGVVVDEIEAMLAEELAKLRITDIELDEVGLR